MRADAIAGPRNEAGLKALLPLLAAQFGSRFQTSEAVRGHHTHTTTYLPRQLPDGVVFVESADDVKAVVRLCATHRVPVIPFGIGSSLEGQVNAPSGGTCHFDSIDAACRAVIMTIQLGIPVARIELLDAMQVRACNAYSGLTHPEKPTLFLEFHGSSASVDLQSAEFAAVVAELGGSPFRWTADASERAQLWKARHNAYYACRALAPQLDALTTDVCVPISRFADCVVETQKDIADCGFLAPIVGHAGDGNFHVLVLFDARNDADVERVEAFVARLNARALAMGGTCTGEHGIGQGKKAFLDAELGGSVGLMRQVKAALDPDNIFNPGKIF